MFSSLPGWDIVSTGIRDLEAGRETVEALVVSMAVTRLRGLGLAVPDALDDPTTRLYRRLEREHGAGAHSKYNAYRRQLASFLRSAPCVMRSTPDESERS